MKLRAPKGEGALTLEELDGSRTRPRGAGRPAAAAGRALRRRRPARSARRHLRPRPTSTSSCSGTCSATRNDDNDALVSPGRGVSRAAARHQRRALRHAGRAAAVRRAHLRSASTPRWTRAGRRLAANAERYLKPPAQMARLFADRPEARARHARAGRSARVHDAGSRLPLSEVSGAAAARPRCRSCARSPRSARAIATGRITTRPARRWRASSISSRSSISPATS